MKHARDDYNRIQDPSGLIPDEEPVFLLRAQDKLAWAAVSYYAKLAESAGSSGIAEKATLWAEKMRTWPTQKVPDLPSVESVPVISVSEMRWYLVNHRYLVAAHNTAQAGTQIPDFVRSVTEIPDFGNIIIPTGSTFNNTIRKDSLGNALPTLSMALLEETATTYPSMQIWLLDGTYLVAAYSLNAAMVVATVATGSSEALNSTECEAFTEEEMKERWGKKIAKKHMKKIEKAERDIGNPLSYLGVYLDSIEP